MNENERIRYLRKKILKIKNSNEFAQKINISGSNLRNIENGTISLTNRVLEDICDKYNVSKQWIKEGIGEIFEEKSSNSIITDLNDDLFKLKDKYNLSDLDMVILKNYLEMDSNEREIFVSFLYKLLKNKNTEETKKSNTKSTESKIIPINNPTEQNMDDKETRYYELPYYDIPVSAGTGEILDSDHCEMFTMTVAPPDGADFMLRVSGNSMEPTYYDGDKLFIKKQDAVDIGGIGIFVVDGNVYVKEFCEGGLISHNPNYSKITFNEFDIVCCLGKVVGVYRKK